MTSNEQLATSNALKSIIAAALAEDVGSGDITSQLLLPEHLQAELAFVARKEMIACGAFIPGLVYEQLNDQAQVEIGVEEGRRVGPGTPLARVSGPARALLAGERVALNLMQRACGVATLTAAYVEAVKGTKAVILDTRKTLPGLRALDKYAVRAGGGANHRMGLYDMVLIKDNHLALRGQDSGFGIQGIMEEVRKKLTSLNPESKSLIPVVIECDTLSQVEQALAALPDRILLDNMDPAALREAVRLAHGRVPLEASGGVTLANVRAVAETGVDYISVGALTHSAPAADIGADVKMSGNI